MTIQEYEEKLLQLIDDGIDTATDDELFAGGGICAGIFH